MDADSIALWLFNFRWGSASAVAAVYLFSLGTACDNKRNAVGPFALELSRKAWAALFVVLCIIGDIIFPPRSRGPFAGEDPDADAGWVFGFCMTALLLGLLRRPWGLWYYSKRDPDAGHSEWKRQEP